MEEESAGGDEMREEDGGRGEARGRSGESRGVI